MCVRVYIYIHTLIVLIQRQSLPCLLSSSSLFAEKLYVTAYLIQEEEGEADEREISGGIFAAFRYKYIMHTCIKYMYILLIFIIFM